MLASNPILGVAIISFSLLFLIYTVFQIKRDRLLLRYSLAWMFLAILLLVFALFPQPIFALAAILGFDVSSNFIFLVAIFFLLVLNLIQTRAISQLVVKNKNVTQRLAILEKRVGDQDEQ